MTELLWPLLLTFFFGGMLSEVAKWYFNEYLKQHAKKIADEIHTHVESTVQKVK